MTKFITHASQRLFCFCLLFSFFYFNTVLSQNNTSISFPEHFAKTAIANLKKNDSLLYYQCHVVEASTEITTVNGEKIKGDLKKISVTEKFLVVCAHGIYKLKYYTSTVSNLPNRKFSYLKVKEKDYWNFKLEKESEISEHDVLMFAAIENKSHDTNEFDFIIDKHITNALIIRNNKIMKHLIIEGNYLLKKNLEVLK